MKHSFNLFQSLWENFPCVVTGVRTREPALPFACVDHYMLARQAVEQCLALGYRRPALVLDRKIDLLVDGRFSAGVFMAQQNLPTSQRTRPFYTLQEAENNPDLFTEWLEKEQPDVLLTLYNKVRHWVEKIGLNAPQDIGLVQLEWRPNRPDWAGMNQHNDRTGRAAVEMLVSRIHRPESVAGDSPDATLVGSSWMDGHTVKSTRPTPI